MSKGIDEKRQQHRGQGIVKSVRSDKGNQGLIPGFEKIYAQKQNVDGDTVKFTEGKPHGGEQVNRIKKYNINQYGDCL